VHNRAHPENPRKATQKDASITTMETPERMGKISSCLFSFNTLKLLVAMVQPLENLVMMFIEIVFW